MYSLKNISRKMNDTIEERDKALAAITAVELPPHLKMHLSDAVYKFYQPTLSQLKSLLACAEWYVTKELNQ
jgi:hypothetical protein